jgi:hypothetical protein
VNGNHRADTIEYPTDELPVGEPSPAKNCRGCGQRLDGPDTKVWCSQSCRNRYRVRAPAVDTVD